MFVWYSVIDWLIDRFDWLIDWFDDSMFNYQVCISCPFDWLSISQLIESDDWSIVEWLINCYWLNDCYWLDHWLISGCLINWVIDIPGWTMIHFWADQNGQAIKYIVLTCWYISIWHLFTPFHTTHFIHFRCDFLSSLIIWYTFECIKAWLIAWYIIKWLIDRLIYRLIDILMNWLINWSIDR